MAKKEEKAKSSRKILVEFEMNPEDVKKLLQSGKKQRKALDEAELDKLIEVGAIKASEYLDQNQMDEASRGISSWIKKVGGKIKKAISNPTVQTTVVTTIAGKLTAREMEKELDFDEVEKDKPID